MEGTIAVATHVDLVGEVVLDVLDHAVQVLVCIQESVWLAVCDVVDGVEGEIVGPAGQVDDALLVSLVREALFHPLDEERDNLIDGGLVLGDGAHVEVGLDGAANGVVIGCIGAGEEVGDGVAVCDWS